MKHFYPDVSGLIQDDNDPIHRARGVTEGFVKKENYIIWLSQSPDLQSNEWETDVPEFSYRLEESIPRRIAARLVYHLWPNISGHFTLVFPLH